MEKFNLGACILFGILAVICLIVAVATTKFQWLAPAAGCIAVSLIAYDDYVNPQL